MTINFCYQGFQILKLQKMGYLSSKTWGSLGKQVCNSCISPSTLLGLLTEDHSRVSFKIIVFFPSCGGKIHSAGEAVGLALASLHSPKR